MLAQSGSEQLLYTEKVGGSNPSRGTKTKVIMRQRRQSKFRVRPINIRNGNTAPYFIMEPEPKAKREAVEALAQQEFRASGLSRYDNWQLSIERI